MADKDGSNYKTSAAGFGAKLREFDENGDAIGKKGDTSANPNESPHLRLWKARVKYITAMPVQIGLGIALGIYTSHRGARDKDNSIKWFMDNMRDNENFITRNANRARDAKEDIRARRSERKAKSAAFAPTPPQ